MKIRQIFRIEGGILDGTEIEQVMMFFLVKYPHRKNKDIYIPPTKTEKKVVRTWHCNYENCPKPDFEGGLDALVDHLMLHKGRLVKPWSKKAQLKNPIPMVKIPPNSYTGNDRRFVVDLYIQEVVEYLERQGIEVDMSEAVMQRIKEAKVGVT